MSAHRTNKDEYTSKTPVMLRLINSGDDWRASYIAAPDMPFRSGVVMAAVKW